MESKFKYSVRTYCEPDMVSPILKLTSSDRKSKKPASEMFRLEDILSQWYFY